MKNKKHRIKRKCLICGKTLNTTIYHGGKYSNGHYFGEMELPIEGKGKYIKTGKTRIGKIKGDIVKWVGKKKKMEYWECNNCFEQAGHEQWLEEKITKLYGERCPDFEPECALCQAWEFFDIITGKQKLVGE